MVDFLKTWGTLIIAVIALVQPWVLSVWRRFFRQQEVDVFETGNVEVGFSSFGPTVGLQGTLRAVHRGAFISSVVLEIVRVKDSLEHKFEWGVFRSPTISLDTNQSGSYELCRSFLLSEHFPSPYSIQFWDRDTQNDLRPLLEQIRTGWTDHFMTRGGEQVMKEGADVAGLAEELQKLTKDLYKDFSKEKLYVDVYSAVQRLFYWDRGWYRLEMTVKTSRPERYYTRQWQFELTEKDAEGLRLNILTTVDSACAQQRGALSFAYPHYVATGKA